MHVSCLIKYPNKGSVKTRLAEQIGSEGAVQAYCAMLDFTFDLFDPETGTVDYPITFHCSGAGKQDFSFLTDGRFALETQKGEGLGERLKNIVVDHFEHCTEKLCIIGSDCLELDLETFLLCDQMLDDYDVVLGPSRDGGYYLVAMRQQSAGIFNEISWSTSSVFEETVNRIKEEGLSAAYLPKKTDVDTWQDLPNSLKKKFPPQENLCH